MLLGRLDLVLISFFHLVHIKAVELNLTSKSHNNDFL